MSTPNPEAPPAPPRPPGLYRWDGQTFRRAQPSQTPAVVGLLAAIAAFLIGLGIGHASAGSAATSATSTTTTAAPQATTAATTAATPTPAPTPLTLSGQGSKVVDFDLPKGSYKLAWQAQGHDNFIVHLEGDRESNLVNEIPPNPSSGETFVRLGGGHYSLNVKASTLSWSITFTPEA